jgi:hypothetical protein
MNNYRYTYAIGGESCQTNMDVLVDNKKFLDTNDMIYNLAYTRMQRYPLYNMWTKSDNLETKKSDKSNQETDNQETDNQEQPKKETYAKSFGCCGGTR